MNTKTLSMVAAAFCPALFADVPQIRYTSAAPFDAEGRRVESVWSKADTCIRFVEVNTMDVALDQSEAQLLFDDSNLYASLVGFYDAKMEKGDPTKGRSSSNNFELFVKIGDGASFHAIVDEFGRTYFAKDKNELNDCGAKANVEKGKAPDGRGCWRANLAIPFKAFDAAAPRGDARARVGVFRMNINVHERAKVYSMKGMSASGYTPNKYNYGVSDTWAEMDFTRSEGEPKRVEGPAMGYRINLFANPDFDVPGRGWSPMGRTAYQETMAMSGEWIYRSSGKDYQVLQTRPLWVKPNTKYTLVVKARSFGSGSALRIVEMARNKGGKVYEGRYVTMSTPVGPEMHAYYLPFTSAPDEPWTMVFYKVDNRADDTGIDFASIRLYEGEISSFEIRKVVRPGRMAPIAGTEVPAPPSAYGRIARPLRALVVVDQSSTREPLDVFGGTGAQVDVLVASGKDQDVYSTDDDPAAITKRLEGGGYDVYMIPRNGADKVGKELAGKILANVGKGAGLYLEQSRDYLHFKSVSKGGACGKGRVFAARTAGPNHAYLPNDPLSEYDKSFLPRRMFQHPQVVADAVETAFGAAAVPASATTRVESFVYGGVRHVATWALDAKGRTLSWRREAQPVAGAKLGAFEDDGKTSAVAIEGDAAGMTLKWEFSDFSGRVLARGSEPVGRAGSPLPAAKVSFRIPRERLYTNYGGIRLELARGGEVVDQRGECIFVKGNDRARQFGDFTPSMWPGGGPLDDIQALSRQLEGIGIRSSFIPTGGTPAYEQYLSCGLSVGGGALGDGSMFCGWLQKSNVRAQNFNAAKWRAEKPVSVRKKTAATAKFGLFQYVLCDEPNLSRPGSADELDAHPENLAEYRRRMEAKYGTIAEYNRRHLTAHKSFEDLGQALQADARASGKFAEFIEWRSFNVDRWCEAIRLVSDSAREGDPDTPFSMCNSFGQSALSGNDYWKLLTRAGLGMSQEYTSMVYFGRGAIYNFDEFFRSFRPDMRVWGWTGYFYSNDRAKFMPWWTAAHRYGGFSWYAATAPGYNIIDGDTFAFTIDGRDLKKSLEDSRLMDGLGMAFLAYDWAKRDVAIYYSHESMLLATIRGPETKNGEIAAKSPLHDYMYSRQGAQYLVEDLLYQHDFVAPEQIAGGKLAECRVLFMPRINAMSDAEVAAVKAFLAKGGRVVADELPGGCDELGVRRAANPFEGLAGVTVTGKNFDDLDKAQRAATLKLLGEAGARSVLPSPTSVDVFGREAMHFTDGMNDIYVVIRHPARSQDDASETFVFPRGGFAWDVRARKPLGRVDRAEAKIPLPGAAVYSVMQYEAKRLELTAPAEAKAGDLVGVSLRLAADGAPVGTHVFNVRFVPPSGECRFHFRRNVTAKGGAAKLDFPLAFNDECGEWKIIAEDALTGLRAERSLTVR